MSHMMQPTILLLREGTDSSQGKAQLISNINAISAVVDILRTTLGPRGMDKLIRRDGVVTISNDGATLMKLLDIVHPAAKTLVDIARSQDAEVGDGTTSVVVLAGELLREAKPFVEDGVHAQTIVRAFRHACALAVAKIDVLQVPVAGDSTMRLMLERQAATSLSSKLVSGHKQFFAKMVVDAVLSLSVDMPMNMIGIKKVQGGALQDSQLVNGVAFKKSFSYAGFEQQRKSFVDPPVLLLNVELELKAEKDNAEIRITKPSEYQAIVDAEWSIIYEKLDLIAATGAKVVLSRLPIGDLATQYFADNDIFCAGRVPMDDLQRVAASCGGTMQATCNGLSSSVLGHCELFEEKQVGGERFNFFTGCKAAKSVTILLRGGAEQFIDEAERSLQDAILSTRRLVKNPSIVAGGGAIEMELSAHLREASRGIYGKQQLLVAAYAKALEVIPRQVAENGGLDATDILNKLRQKHAQGHTWFGVDVNEGDVCDTYEAYVWEATVMKRNAIAAATEAACLILSVDETVRNPQSEQPNTGSMRGGGVGQMRGRGRGGGGRGRR